MRASEKKLERGVGPGGRVMERMGGNAGEAAAVEGRSRKVGVRLTAYTVSLGEN